MNKAYSNMTWKNFPSTESPINEDNLNAISTGLNEVDNRVIELDTTKTSKVDMSTAVMNVSFDSNTGKFTITQYNGVQYVLDTVLEKVITNFAYDSDTQSLVLTLEDGTVQSISLAEFITQYEFTNSGTVAFTVDADGKVSAVVPDGSITESKISTDYVAKINTLVNNASASATSALNSANSASASKNSASASEKLAESWAIGGTGSRNGEDTNNSKYYAEQSAKSATNVGTYEKSAKESASTAKEYAIGETESAKRYYEQAKSISESFSGALKPMGTVTFAKLPSVSSATVGDMYNVSDEFTTTSNFVEGSGYVIPAGSNVYMTSSNKWDVLAGSPVTGVKGNAETSYRRGNVNITPSNIGAVDTTTFSDFKQSADTSISKINTSLGSVDISSIGDGTVTGAIDYLKDNGSGSTEDMENLARAYAIAGRELDRENVVHPLSAEQKSGTFSYTAPKDGVLCMSFGSNGNTKTIVYLNGNQLSMYTGSTSVTRGEYIPLRKGDVVTTSALSNTNTVMEYTYFVPYKLQESVATTAKANVTIEEIAKMVKELGVGEPDWENAIHPLSANFTSGTWEYTTPSDGVLFLHWRNASNTKATFTVNGIVFADKIQIGEQMHNVPMSKGDSISITTMNDGSYRTVYADTVFVPYKPVTDVSYVDKAFLTDEEAKALINAEKPKHIYSTEEHIVGTLKYSGKELPVYEKTWMPEPFSGQDVCIDSTFTKSHLDRVLGWDGSANPSSGASANRYVVFGKMDSNHYPYINDSGLWFAGYSSGTISNLTLTIRYTKASDL